MLTGAWLSWLERYYHTVEVRGSSPCAPTINRLWRFILFSIPFSSWLEARCSDCIKLSNRKSAYLHFPKRYNELRSHADFTFSLPFSTIPFRCWVCRVHHSGFLCIA